MDGQYRWEHKDLLDIASLSPPDVQCLLDLATSFQEINLRPIRKVPTLKGKTIMLFFAENSTRTRVSFDVAGKRLSADTYAMTTAGSSINKGESLSDTCRTLEAMQPDVIVIRHSASGAAKYIAERLKCSVVNAGDGWHAHPTQALLDAFSLKQVWQGAFSGKSLLILGDIAHSRVARSNVQLLNMLGVKVSLCAPRTLLPPKVETWPVTVYSSLDEAIVNVDAVMGLRLQLERQQAGLLPNLSEYSRRYCLSSEHLKKAKPTAYILHPGPLNRGLEISSELADSPQSLILDQVSSGVAIRMAILYLLATRNQT